MVKSEGLFTFWDQRRLAKRALDDRGGRHGTRRTNLGRIALGTDELRARSLRAICGLAVVLTSSASWAASQATDGGVTVFVNAKVFTAEPTAPYAEALAVAGDRIRAVGQRRSVLAAAGTGARVVDLNGRFLLPGMVDAHAHPIGSSLVLGGGMGLVMANYTVENGPIEQLLAFVADTVAGGKSRYGDVAAVLGVDTGYWSHARELDAQLSHGRFAAAPIVLIGSDGHTAWCNLAVRKRAGISAAMLRALPAGESRYYGFDADFEPNGFVVDRGLTRLLQSLPEPPPDLLLAAARAGVRNMNSLGITAWLDAAAAGVVGGDLPLTLDGPSALTSYRELSRRGELTAHVAAYPVIDPRGGVQQIEVMEALRKKFGDVPNLTMPGIKVFADGVVEYPSQTAALTVPYRNTGTSAPLLFDPASFDALVTEADRRGLTVHIHAIGDLAVKASLDAIGAARQANPKGLLPHTITHVQFIDREDEPRFAQYGVIAALQLLWAATDPSTTEAVQPYIDARILATMYPARSLLQAGAVIAGASDWPVSDANPFLAIAQAETRTGPEGVLDAGERMPREAMLYAYTRNAARALGQAESIGSLAPGKKADLVLVDRDILTVSPDELRKTEVVWTMFGGKVVYGNAP